MASAPRSTSSTPSILAHPKNQIPTAFAGIVADGGPYTLRNTTAHFKVYYENALGANGPVLADAVLATCESDYQHLQNWFGVTPGGLPFTIYVVTGNFGAYHANCAATELHCAADTGTNIPLIHMLMVAEADEVFMNAQGKWGCGLSTGEGLSRVLSTELYPSALNGYTSAASWLNAAGRPNFIDSTDPTDRNYVSIGCSVLFLNWLHYQLGYSWQQIIAAGAPTEAELYTNLTGAMDGWTRFSTLMAQVYPPAVHSSLGVDNPYPLQAQSNWRWCHKCQGLSFGGNASQGPCPAGGNHDHTGSGNYQLEMNTSIPATQPGWEWCRKCQELAFAFNGTPGPCPAGGNHDHTGSGMYTLAFTVAGSAGQSNWKWCRKCQAIAFAGNPTVGKCPAGGNHDHTGSGNYTLDNNAASGITGQSNWKWCNKCQVLAFAGNPSPGPCAAGGNHDHAGSGNYTLAMNIPALPLQTNWRWCNKCQGLAFGGSATPGNCPAGGTHDHTGSGDYSLLNNALDPQGQGNWRWCHKCQGMAFAGSATLGPCPAGGNHDHAGSGNYNLSFA
jgi:hypothetical protein